MKIVIVICVAQASELRLKQRDLADMILELHTSLERYKVEYAVLVTEAEHLKRDTLVYINMNI